ncbi:MAG: amidohydrolase family protein, partial [Eubacteriales bacterium]|nr:amidohydrolase family protein [Eubacteriales bacterium]
PDIQVIIDRGRAFMEYSDQYMAGSDTMYPGMIAGFSLHEELERLVNLYGCTPYEALKAATVNPALFMGLERQKGRLLPGMDADILILNNNPLADIKNTRSIRGVIQGNTYYDRPRLDALLEEVRTMPDSEVEFLAPLL